jgi:hypothetical protein
MVMLRTAWTGRVSFRPRGGLWLSQRDESRLSPRSIDVNPGFHSLRDAAGAAGRLADPHAIVDAQWRELLRLLRDTKRAAMTETEGSTAGLLLEGLVLRLQPDLRWLAAREQHWAARASNE